MELNEAIDNINLLITNLENMSIKEIEPENYILLNSLNTVLEELDNRIPRKDIEDKIEKVRCETTWNYNDWKYDKKVYNAEHNMINIIEKELLNKE